ncbi:MAG: hypothetical protein HY855_02730 [Burkholderiales bacterium]|nr:hypothetical protein [Burkholderiales bacterium]
MNTDDDTEQLIEDCEARESKLSDWERTFIDSIRRQRAQGRDLSAKQLDVLNRTWERVTAKG